MKFRKNELINTKVALHRLSKLVRNHRAQLDLTYREYRRLFSDLSPNINNIEKENFVDLPSHLTLSRLADILGISYSQLINYLDEGGIIEGLILQPDKNRAISIIKQIRDFEDLLDIEEELDDQKRKVRKRRSDDRR